MTGLQDDPGADLLAVTLVRHAEDLHVPDVFVAQQEFLDLARIDILAATDQHVLDPADDLAIALGVDCLACALVPEVLIVTTVGQEGIDLHRECRHVIHHDLPWNPATLEQRTGRVDRIGSKTERLRGNENGDCYLDVVVPYIAGTYDEHRFRVVHGRAHIFDVTMGGKYAVDGHRSVLSPSESETAGDDPGEPGVAWIPVPETIATDLRVYLEVEPAGGGGISALPTSPQAQQQQQEDRFKGILAA